MAEAMDSGHSTPNLTQTEEEEDQSQQTETIMLKMKQDYETQHFGFTPKSFSDGMYNALLEITADSYFGLKKYILLEYSHVVNEQQLDKVSELFMPKVTTSLDKAFDKFEGYILQNIFSIPPNVLLPEDSIHRDEAGYTDADVQSIDSEIETLMEKIEAEQYMNDCMKQELENVERVHNVYKQYLQLQNTSKKMLFSMGVSDLKESFAFTKEKADKIENVVQRLDAELKEELHKPVERRTEGSEIEDHPLKLKKPKLF